MKIETIESAIAAIESAGYKTIPKTKGHLWWKKITGYDVLIESDQIRLEICGHRFYDLHLLQMMPSEELKGIAGCVMTEDELIEFAKLCQLKAFW